MESLAGLKSNATWQAMVLSLSGGGPRDVQLRRHFTNFVRLVDVALRQYEAARKYHEDSTSPKPGGFERVTWALRATDNLELCVITTRRALNSMRALESHRAAPGVANELRDSRELRNSLKRFNLSIGDLRNTIEHTECDINRGDISVGQSHALRISPEGSTASIGSHVLSLDDLANALRQMHDLASDLAEYVEEKGAAGSNGPAADD